MKTRYLSLLLAPTLTLGTAAPAADAKKAATLVVVSPHHNLVRQEVGDAFTKSVKDAGGGAVAVVWIDQGGTIANLRYVKQRVAEAKRSKGGAAGIDIIWGGGSETFDTLKDAKVLAPVVAPKGLFTQKSLATGANALLDGAYDRDGYWLGTAVSTFGVIVDEARLQALAAGGPALLGSWDSLADPRLNGRLIAGDPRTSAVSAYMLPSFHRLMGWEKAWRSWVGLYGNSGLIGRRTSDTLAALQSHQADVGLIIDFLALSAPGAQPGGPLRYQLPEPKQDVDVDPIGKVVGGPNSELADKFIRFVVSEAGQKLMSQPVGSPGGPKANAIGRIAVLKSLKPTAAEEKQRGHSSVATLLATKRSSKAAPELAAPFLRDLIGETLVDHVVEVRQAWGVCIKAGKVSSSSSPFAPPFTPAELKPLQQQWQDVRTRRDALATIRGKFLAALEATKVNCAK